MSKYDNQPVFIKSLKNGDENAYRYLINTYGKLIFNYALSLTNDRALSQDIVQEVFLSVWKERKKINEAFSFKNYIYRITYNKFINQYHKNRALSNLEIEYGKALNEVLIGFDKKESTEKKLKILNESINNLPKKCKEVFLLSKKEGLTNIEISEYLNVSIKTVEGHLTKAFKILKKKAEEKMKIMVFFLSRMKKAFAFTYKSF